MKISFELLKEFLSAGRKCPKSFRELPKHDRRLVQNAVSRAAKRYTMQGDDLYRLKGSLKVKVLLSREEVEVVLRTMHGEGKLGPHVGTKKMQQDIAKRYFWQGMTADIKKRVTTCPECQSTQQKNTMTPELRPIIKSRQDRKNKAKHDDSESEVPAKKRKKSTTPREELFLKSTKQSEVTEPEPVIEFEPVTEPELVTELMTQLEPVTEPESVTQLKPVTEFEPVGEYFHLARAWAFDLSKAAPEQQLFAKKAISDIIFEAQMGSLHRHSVCINSPSASLNLKSPVTHHNG